MKNVLVASIISLAAVMPLHAKTSIPLVCALGEKQDLAELNGFIVEQGTKKKTGGGIESFRRIVSYTNGQETDRSDLSASIIEYTEAELEKEEIVYSILKAAKIDPALVKSGKSISLTGEPSVQLVNFFDEDEKMLTGAIIVPTGGIQICHPVSM